VCVFQYFAAFAAIIMAINQFKSRRKIKKAFYSPIMVVLLALVLAALARSTWGIYEKFALSGEKLSQAQRQLADLKSQEGQLSQSIAQLSTASGAEAVMRTDFRIVKPGESLAVIIDTATATATTTVPLGFWQRLGKWFKGTF